MLYFDCNLYMDYLYLWYEHSKEDCDRCIRVTVLITVVIYLPDYTGKKDTVPLSDYMERQKYKGPAK
jgi:hypothetical protein